MEISLLIHPKFYQLFQVPFYPNDPPTDNDVNTCNEPVNILNQEPNVFPPLTYEEISTSLYDMSKGKAPGNDGIRVEILQFVYPEICTHLFIIYQACLNLCYFPSAWKIATVAIIPKPDRADDILPTSYRPIGLLPVLGKLFETIVNRRLQYLATTNSWFSSSQHGFISAKSTTALHSFVSSIKHVFTHRAKTYDLRT